MNGSKADLPHANICWPSLPVTLTCLLLLAAHWAFALSVGPRFSPDSQRYDVNSEQLLSRGERPFSAKSTHFGIPLGLYRGFEVLCAGAKLVTREHWPWMILLLNMTAFSACALGLISETFRFTSSNFRALGAGILFLSCPDIALWTPLVLGDALFTAATFFFFLLTLKAHPSPSFLMTWLMAAAAMLILRPTGALFVTGTALGFAVASAVSLRTRVIVGISLLSAGAIGIAYHSSLILRPAAWPIDFAQEYFQMIAADYREGIVVHMRRETYLTPAHDIWSACQISLAKFIRFFQVSADGYSTSHKWLSGGTLSLTFASASWGFASQCIRSDSKRRAYGTGIILTVFVAGFHAITQLDFDWRYRTPLLPVLIFLAAIASDYRASKTQPAAETKSTDSQT